MNSVIKTIKSKYNIIDILHKKTLLRKIDDEGNYICICPFHNKSITKRNPTMFINAIDQTYYCCECGEKGDLIDLIVKLSKLEFDPAIKKICQKKGIVFDVQAVSRDRLFQMNKDANNFFCNSLKSKKGENCLKYLTETRGLTQETINAFGMGYAPDTWTGLCDHMISLGYNADELMKASLITKSKNGKFIDFFFERAVFPFYDTNGNIVGFGGRTLANSDRKYLNSKSSEVYRKNEFLFSLNFAKEAILEKGYAILVEGNLDVITLHQAGFNNTVAPCGTSLTKEQCRLLSQYTKKVVICYDSDDAGKNAKIKAIDSLEKFGIICRVMTIEGAKDPDELIKNLGAKAFGEQIKKSVTSLHYLLETFAEDTGLNNNSSEYNKSLFFNKVYNYLSDKDGIDEKVIKELNNYI